MNTDELKKICSQFPGTTSRLYGHPSNILVYFIGDKKFAYFKTSEPERWRFSIRVTADRFIELTDVAGIKPARYFSRFHWISIVNPHNLSPDYLNELILWSYKKALGSLSKVQQMKLLNNK
ncbi:MAG: MmcQ/YjbR family DNA-binding protein [Arenimonas sp.]